MSAGPLKSIDFGGLAVLQNSVVSLPTLPRTRELLPMPCTCCAPQALTPVPFPQFAAEICDVYRAGSARATVAKMQQVLGEFAPLCSSTADVSLHSISSWLTGPGCRRRSVMTRRSLLSAFRAACSLGAAQGRLVNPFLTWDLDRWLPEPDPEELDRPWLCRSGAEISRVLRRASVEAAGGQRKAERTRALVFLLAYTGCRAKEALGALTADVDLGGKCIKVRPNPWRKLKTKASRRELPLHPELVRVLGPYLPTCGRFLFGQQCGRGPWFNGGPGYRPLDVVAELGERVAVDGLTLSSFRHTFASLAEERGISELQLMHWLGHSRPTTQRWYRRRKADFLAGTLASINY
jgi:integrase